MAKGKADPKVDAYFAKPGAWQAELKALRAIALDSPLEEVMKWGNPCYTWEGGNVVLIHAFKEYCAFLFFKGALLKDGKGLLIQQTRNVQGARQIRFTSVKDIAAKKSALKAYIREATEVEKAGLKVELKKTADFPMPEEFRARLARDRALKAAFAGLTPGRQRAYLLYFSDAKQSKTREARIEKYAPAILDGLGLND